MLIEKENEENKPFRVPHIIFKQVRFKFCIMEILVHS